jgi:hypothetical protein
MRNLATIVMLLALVCGAAVAQEFSVIAEHNAYATKHNSTLPDSLKPYLNDQGVRGTWVAPDIDHNGKPEILATDYSNGGRVHAFEMTAPNTLELVWSSARIGSLNPNSVPRWVRTGDLDGDGNMEIIFPVGARYTGEIAVYEYNGTEHGFGDPVTGGPTFTLPAAQFAAQLGGSTYAFRMDREAATVADVDGDGRSELIFHNQSNGALNNVYVLGVAGEFPGFGSWQVEGGDPTVAPENGFIGPSHWNSVPADINGDGKLEIVNHYYDYYGFWSIDVTGPDTYRYPKPVAEGKSNYVYQFLKNANIDACAYFGVVPVDVDADGKDEIAGIIYDGLDPADDIYSSSVALVSVAKGDTGVYVWRDSTQWGLIGTKLWEKAGKTTGSHWVFSAYDFNGNGRPELLVGGSADYNITSLEYNGTGNILDAANYTSTITYPGDKARYHVITIYDSLGVLDTTWAESPFMTKMYPGADINGDGKKDLVIAYQSIADSIAYTHYVYDTLAIPKAFRRDSTWKILNTNVINIRVLTWNSTGFTPLDMSVVTPDDYKLEANYPNPFNPSTNIRFALPVDKKISLIVYDMLGREVKTLIGDELYKKGSHETTWNGTNNAGNTVASGSYIYTLKFGNFTKSAKMTLLK